MAYRSEKATSLSHWCFLKRKALVVAFGVMALAAMAVEHHDWLENEEWLHDTLTPLAWCLVVLGIVVRMWATLHIGGHKSKRIIDAGPYAFTRNPLYLGSFLAVLGTGVLSESVVACALGILPMLFIYRATVLHEERKLLDRFGDEYADYLKRVPRFLPRLAGMRGLVTVDVQQISYRDIGRESYTALGFAGSAAGIMLLEELFELWREAGHLPKLITF